MISNDEILSLLEEKGYKSYLVGGCLRDSLLNKESHDVDISTQALPDEILEVFKDYKTVDIGKKIWDYKSYLLWFWIWNYHNEKRIFL